MSHASLQQRKTEAGSVARVPAAEIEKLVLDGVRTHYASMDVTEDLTAIADRDLIERHVHSVTVRPQALEVCLVPPSDALAQTEEPNRIVASNQLPMTPTTIALPWTAPSFAAMKGIVHAPPQDRN